MGGAGGAFGGSHVGGGFGGGHFAGGRMDGGQLGGFAGARTGSLDGGHLHAPRLGGGFEDGHHRFRGTFRGGAFGYFPSYDYGYADSGDYADDGACFQYQHIHTAAGWRWRQVWVCN
jgi:hypothetical protein